MDEAIEWVKRIPFDPDSMEGDGEIEIRPVFEAKRESVKIRG